MMSTLVSDICGERACPALGCEAPPIKESAVYLTRLRAWFWGCCAAQRRTSLLATGNLRLTERHWACPLTTGGSNRGLSRFITI